MTIPRSWLIALALLFLGPWVIALVLFVRTRSLEASTDVRPEVPSPAIQHNAGPWGDLVSRPIVISPPQEQVPKDFGPLEPTVWCFPQVTRDLVERFLESSGLPRDQVASLMASSRYDEKIQGLIIKPDPEIVWKMDPRARSYIYIQLSRTPLNARHHDAYRFTGGPQELWLRENELSPATVQLIKPLIYSHGAFLFFADIHLLRTRVTDGEELHRLAKNLLRVPTMISELHLKTDSNLDAIAEYWGRGGRRLDIRPLIESVAMDPNRQTLDISHLLPPVARLSLYRYPKPSIESFHEPELGNCLWTALNFFSQQPDNKLSGLEPAMNTLKRSYYLVHDEFQLGDVVTLHDDANNLFHAAVYLADNLVFTKNGLSPLSPWVIMPLERLKGYYVQFGDNLQVIYHRRKDI